VTDNNKAGNTGTAVIGRVLRAGPLAQVPIRAKERPALRKLWVDAVEAALDLETPGDFMSWLHEFVRPVLHYEFVVCGTGVFSPHSVLTDRLLVRGFPRPALDVLRDAQGVITLPRGRRQRERILRPVELRSLEEEVGRHRGPSQSGVLGTLAVLDRAEVGCRFGSYFLFGRLRDLPGPSQQYFAGILGPIMHAALGHTLDAEPALRPKLSAGVRLTRRETELLGALVAGQTTPEIAAASHRSIHTISNQIRAILRKLDASTRTEAIALALSLGLVRPQRKPDATRVIAAQVLALYEVTPRPSSPPAARDPCGSEGFPGLVMTKAAHEMVIDDTHGLKIGVDDGRADEFEPELL